jgi:hypothetical protein
VVLTPVESGRAVVLPHSPALPSKTTDKFWLSEWAPNASGLAGPRSGKWVVTVDEQDLDAAWAEIRMALLKGKLGPAAKTRTAMRHPFLEPDGKTVICVYVEDSLDAKDRNRVLGMLGNLGFQNVKFRTDEESLRDWRSCLPG